MESSFRNWWGWQKSDRRRSLHRQTHRYWHAPDTDLLLLLVSLSLVSMSDLYIDRHWHAPDTDLLLLLVSLSLVSMSDLYIDRHTDTACTRHRPTVVVSVPFACVHVRSLHRQTHRYWHAPDTDLLLLLVSLSIVSMSGPVSIWTESGPNLTFRGRK